MFVVLLTYVRPLEEVDRHMKAHMAHLREAYREKRFIASGRRIPRSGGVILARGHDKEVIQALMEKDPFVIEGVATFEIIEFNTSQSDPAFKPFVDP